VKTTEGFPLGKPLTHALFAVSNTISRSPSLCSQIVSALITLDLREDDELWELLFADDLVIMADMEEELQQRYLVRKNSLERKGMRMNTQKTEVIVSSREGHEENQHHIGRWRKA